MGRIREAVRVLQGQRMTPQAMQADFIEIQAAAAQMFNNMNALAARLVRAERKLMERQQEELQLLGPSHREPAQVPDTKAALRARAFQLTHGGASRKVVNGAPIESTPCKECGPNEHDHQGE